MEDLLSEQFETISEDIYCSSEDGKYRYVYSPDKKYRYWLEAKVCENPKQDGAVLFIMLNPGTEEGKEERKEHTTRNNCERFAREQGYGTLWTCNLFAFRASGSDVIKCKSHIGENNDSYILKYAHQAKMIVCAWGNAGSRLGRSHNVRETLSDNGFSCKMHHLGLNQPPKSSNSRPEDAMPKHPRILRLNAQPIPYRPPWHS